MAGWLVTGAGGALGSDLVEVLRRAGAEVVGLTRDALDITDGTAVGAALEDHRPAVVVNAAAYTQVDDAEADEATATRVNGTGPGLLAQSCAATSTRLIHVSTDYVFDGTATVPYDVDAATAPTSAYGRSKLAGETAVFAAGGDVHVVRTGWLYGERGPSFIRTVGRRLRAGEPLAVVVDQRGAPTWTYPLAQRLVALGAAHVDPGVWHCSAAGEATWHDVAVALAKLLGADPGLVSPTTSEAFVRPARRPGYSVLSNRRWLDAGLPPMADWREMLAIAVSTFGEQLFA